MIPIFCPLDNAHHHLKKKKRHYRQCATPKVPSFYPVTKKSGTLLTFSRPAMVNYVKTCLVLFLFSVLLFYAYNSINKFNEKKIAVSTYRDFGDSDKELRYPSVTVCSGFRKGIETPESIVRKVRKRNLSYYSCFF